MSHKQCSESHSFLPLILLFFSLLCIEFANAVSPTSWTDGQQYAPRADFHCPPSGTPIVISQPRMPTQILHDCRTNSSVSTELRWFIVCSIYMNDGRANGSWIYYGTLDNLVLLPIDSYGQNLGAVVQPECEKGTTRSNNDQVVNKLYFLLGIKTTNVLFSFDLVSSTQAPLDLPFNVTTSVLTQANHTLIMASSQSSLNLTLVALDLNTMQFTTLNSATPCSQIDDLMYDSLSQTLSATCRPMDFLWTSVGFTMRQSSNGGHDSDKGFDELVKLNAFASSSSLIWLPSLPPAECPTPEVWLRRGQQLFVICLDESLSQQNLMSFTVGEPDHGGTQLPLSNLVVLLDMKAQPNLCAIASVVGTMALRWNVRTQTLFVACSSGSAAAIAIQSTNTTQPIITSLISTGVCSQAASMLGVGYASSGAGETIILQCPEGLFSTSGRSLHLIARVPSISPNLTFFDQASHSIFLLSVPPSSSLASIYRVAGLEVTPIMTNPICQPLSFAYSEQTDQFLLVCSPGAHLTSSINLGTLVDGQIVVNVNQIASSSQSAHQQTIFSTSYGFFLLFEQAISVLLTNPNSITPVQITALTPVTNANILGLQIIQLDDLSLVVGLTYNTSYVISRVIIDEFPQDWYMLEPIYTTNNPPISPYSSLQTFLVDEMRRSVWMMEPQSLVSVNIDGESHSNTSYAVCDIGFNTSAFAVDSLRGRVFVAWSTMGGNDFSSLGVLDMMTGNITQTVSPTTPVTSQIVSMLLNPLTDALVILLKGASQSTQIVVYSDQWTCSPGLQWVDGSCQPCGVSTARGFISYDNATISSPQCLACDVGRFSNISGAAECTLCQPGRYSNSTGSIICNFCEPNRYNNVSGRLSCDKCPGGTDAIDAGSAKCNPCQLGQSNSPGSPCATCALDTFSPGIGSPCLPCTDADQQGLQCINGLALVDSGWWAYQLTPGESKFITTQCPPSFCPGGALQLTNDTSSNATVQELVFCQYPRLNRANNWLCAECVSDHIPWGSSCEPCPHANAGLLTLVIIIAVLLVIFLLRASSAAGSVTILVFFVQVAALELGPVSRWIDWIQFANFGAASTRSCLLPISPIVQNILTMSVPLMLFMILAILCFINHCLSRYFFSRDTSHSNRFIRILDGLTRDFSFDRYIGCVMAILIFCYTSSTVTCVKSLHCVTVAPNIDRLFSSPTITCSSDEYKTFLFPVTLFFLIVYVIGFPLIMFIFLWRSSSMLKQLSTNGSCDPLTAADAIRFTARWSHFYRPYRNEIWFWQPIAMFRRFVFSLISVLLIQSPTSKYVLYSFFGLLSLVVHSTLRPFVETRWNHLESASYLLLINIAYLLTSQTPPFVVSVEVALFLLVVPFSAILIGMTMRTIWFNLRSKSTTKSSSATMPINNDELPIFPKVHSLNDPLLEHESEP